MMERDKLVEMYRLMLKARRFEEKQIELYNKGVMKGMAPHAGIGGEAVGVGACLCLRQDDYILPTHRGFAHAIARGVSLKRLMAEQLGRASGVCKGKGGIHVADFDHGVLGTTGIVGAQLAISVGVGLSIKTRGTDQACLCFFGDGASNRGVFHEALNISALWKLPVVFVCENNMYAIHTNFARASSVQNVADRAGAYGMRGRIVDGFDVEAVYDATCEAVQSARKMVGPTLVECKFYRWRPHSERYFDPRPREEIDRYLQMCPIRRHEAKLVENSILSLDEAKEIEREVTEEVEAAAKAAQEEPFPIASEVSSDVFAPDTSWMGKV
jgi:TPP-dependent pyruvate/acetoin dehydrogenase alpha subunit